MLGRDKQKMAGLKVGDVIRAKVIHASATERRIGLSIRKLETDEEQSTTGITCTPAPRPPLTSGT